MNTTLVSLIGLWPLQHSWVPDCVRSWGLMEGCSDEILLLSDGGGELTPEALSVLPRHLRFRIELDQEQRVAVALEPFPLLRQIRAEDLTWRKILDVAVIGADLERVLLIDTDVLIRCPVRLPEGTCLHYLREDVPAYRAHWTMPLREAMVLSFNAGFVLLQPAAIDLHFLERTVRRYFAGLRNKWWSEQSAWSLLAGRDVEPRFFDGQSACVLSGFATRSAADVRANRVKFISSKQRLTAQQLIAQAGSSPVLHLSGLSKQHFDVIYVDRNRPFSADSEPILLCAHPDPPINLVAKLLLALRLLLLNVFRRG
ncbi:hypothetical protein [Cyanobium sp. ATX 6F1]|uniref:hypothetical protein n=1 Tax=unclassified Cyanobium TaxID=2627006 RepID=UPI0020CC6EFE|nr:hypothetical protein [Cyanobium sp. ATX 6F1]MCP9915822.1 hypothetical protein [Cyanobium sp. ATX 6F1]